MSHLPVIAYAGGKITVPGIYSGVPMKQYHAADICDGPSVSSSFLRLAEQTSMDEVYEKWPGNPDRDDAGDDAAHNVRGRARHTLFLGEHGFSEEFLIRPETYPDDETKPWNGNAKSCKEWLAKAALAGKSVLKPDEIPKIKKAAEKLAAHPTIKGGLLNGLIEHSIFWKDEKTGLWLKARPDAIPTDSAMIADYKGAADVQPLAVRRSITDYGYHQQLALIADGLWATAGLKVEDHYLVFQKWERPFTINVKPVYPEVIDLGRRQNRRALDKIALAIETGVWPGPEDDEVPCGLLDYRMKQLTKEVEDRLLPEIEDPFGAAPQTAKKAEPKKMDKGSAALREAFPEAFDDDNTV